MHNRNVTRRLNTYLDVFFEAFTVPGTLLYRLLTEKVSIYLSIYLYLVRAREHVRNCKIIHINNPKNIKLIVLLNKSPFL